MTSASRGRSREEVGASEWRIFGIPDFSTWVIKVGNAEMRIGAFLNTLISFVMIATAIFFLVVKPMSMMQKKADEEPSGPTEVDLLIEIRDALRKDAA